jgi:hypothetical protein
MSNIISLRNNDLFDANEFLQVHEAPLWATLSAYDHAATRMDSHKAIITDTGTPVAVVGSKYKLVQNRDIMPQFEQALQVSGLDLTGITRKVQQTHGGAKTVVRYRLPAYEVQVGKRADDLVNLEVSVLNSYDGSWSFRSMVGAYRLICTNGMVIGQDFAHFYGKHTKNLDTNLAVMNVRHALSTYTQNVEMWNHFAGREIGIGEALEFFKTVAGGDDNAMYQYLTNKYMLYTDEVGHNVWAVFNCLTDWSTHAASKKTKDENMAALVQKREDKVRQYVPALMRLAA